MQTRVAVISIIIEDVSSVESINSILHEFGEYIFGRMGVPYRAKGINIISIAIDAPQDKINTLAGKIGRLNGVTRDKRERPIIKNTSICFLLMPKIILRQKQKDTSDRGKYRGAAGYGVYILYVLHEPTG